MNWSRLKQKCVPWSCSERMGGRENTFSDGTKQSMKWMSTKDLKQLHIAWIHFKDFNNLFFSECNVVVVSLV